MSAGAELITPTEGETLAQLAAGVFDGEVIVEIGSYKGASACYLARGGVPVHCVDLWDLGGQRHAQRYAQRAVWHQFLANTEGLDITPHKGASVDVAATWDLPVGLLFIDGLHTYDGVRSDLDAWTPHLAPGGLVVFHDYDQRFPGVIEAADEWFGFRCYERSERLAWTSCTS
jgi:predicted O-methyltransferase YrrM